MKHIKHRLGTAAALPPTVSAGAIVALRSPSGKHPCTDGLSQAIAWIGNRVIPLEQALGGAKDNGLEVEWAELALRMTGDGYGYGDSGQ